MMRLLSICWFGVLAAFSVAGAQATPKVPLREPVYRDLDALSAAGLIGSQAVGSRPYSRREISRLLDEAKRNLGRLGSGGGWAARVIEADLRRYAAPPVRLLESATVETTALDSPARTVPADANGGIDALIDPLTGYTDGRRYPSGWQTAIGARLTAELPKYAAFSLEPRLSLTDARGGTLGANLTLQSGGASLLLGNVAIGVGREYVVFGQSPGGGILLSRNAPALDVVRVSTDRPVRLPWVFALLGPASATAFIADLGPHQNVPHAKLIGYRLSVALHPQFELGAQVLDEMGGNGGPAALFRDRLFDVVPLIDIFKTAGDYQFSNKLAGIDLRWRMPRWRGFQLFAEGAVDDLDARRWRSTFLEDGGYVGGVSFSCLMECGVLAVRAEYHQTGIRYYTHTQFSSGIAERQFVLGDALGPRGHAGYLIIDRVDPRLGTLTVTSGFEVRSGNQYGSASTGPNDRGFHFVLLQQRPGEKRYRVLTTWASPIEGRTTQLFTTLGVERADNFAFQAGEKKVNALAQVGVEYRP